MKPIYIKPYETTRTEPEDGCVAYYHEDYVRALSERNEQLKLEYEVLEGCVQNRLIDLGFGVCAKVSVVIDVARARITELEDEVSRLSGRLVYAMNETTNLRVDVTKALGMEWSIVCPDDVEIIEFTKSRIADLEAQLAEARESAVG